MAKLNIKTGFIGSGNMAEAIAGALLQSDIIDASMMMVCDTDPDRLNHMKSVYNISVTESAPEVFKSCDIVILAVKPQVMDTVLASVTGSDDYAVPRRKLIISIAAGISISTFEKALYSALDDTSSANLPVIRVMPNTPSLVLEGMSGICANRHANRADLDIATQILESMGSVVTFEENQMDAVTAVSGSGPAYFFYIIESMVEAGKELGLSSDESLTLAVKTMKGAAKLLEESSESPETLRRKVTSPGGTTEAAIRVLDENHVGTGFKKALKAAAARSKELSGTS